MPAQRSLPVHPNLRYFKLEAKRRMRAGEFGALHQAQRAVAAEHGLPSWQAFRSLIDTRRGTESRALSQLRWVIARFRDASEPGWAAPDEQELRQHFSDEFMAEFPAPELVAIITGNGVDLRREFVVTAQLPLLARLRIDGVEVHASAEPEPPHRINGLYAVAVGTRITDSRIAGPAAGGDSQVPAAVARIAEEAVADLGLPGLVLAGQAGPDAPMWTAAIGLADLDRPEPMTPGHRFPVSQISVLITVVAVLRLVAEGRVGLDDPANDYLRTVALADATITIRELLTHTGGVDSPAERSGQDVPDVAALCGPVLACGGPRGVVQFSVGGYAALGQIIADVTGTAYADAAAQLVLRPLGMTASLFPASVADIATGVVTGYQARAGASFTSVPASPRTVPAACGLWTTAADLVRFGTRWSSLLPAALAREAFRPHARIGPGEGAAGLGWGISPDGDRVGSGQGLGANAFLRVRHAGNHVQVTLANRDAPIEALSRRLLDAIPYAHQTASPRGTGGPG